MMNKLASPKVEGFASKTRAQPRSWLTQMVTVALVAAFFCGSMSELDAQEGAQTQSRTQEAAVNFDQQIPTPDSVVGFALGTKAVRHDDLIRYFQILGRVSPRAVLTRFGQTYEGRPLYYLTISSSENIQRLREIQLNNAKLSDPRLLVSAQEGQQLVALAPAVAWMAYSIHGDELSSTDAAMYLAYRLIAGTDEATRRLLNEVVVHIDPLENPDGRERFMAQLQSLSGAVPSWDVQAIQHSGTWMAGRTSHYLFDLNRDWLVHSHPETRARVRVIRSWNPQLLVDSHEMGGQDTYLMEPPNDPLNLHFSEQGLKWRRKFSDDQGAAFNRYGWSYYTRGWYSEWAPIYTNAWANIIGAAGMLYEQAGVNATSIKQPTGHLLTYREAVQHQVVSSLANLETLRANRQAILADYLADRQWAISDQGPFNETFVLPPAKDRTRWLQLVELIKRHGIEFTFAEQPFRVNRGTDVWGDQLSNMELPAGTLVAFSAQPYRRALHAFLGFDPQLKDDFLKKERTELENGRETLMYDTSAWNLPMAFGLEAYWVKSVSGLRGAATAPGIVSASVDLTGKSAYGYVLDFADYDLYRVLVRLLEQECHPRVAAKPFTMGGRDFAPGAIVLRGHENPDNLAELLSQIAEEVSFVDIIPVNTPRVEKGPDLGGQEFGLLVPPRIAIVSQWPISTYSFGSVWHLLDKKIQARTSILNIQLLSAVDLRRYNVLILPSGDNLDAILNQEMIKNLKRWIEEGGTLIALENSAAFLAGEDIGLSNVQLRRNALDRLDVYAEAVKRERAALKVEIDSELIWEGASSRGVVVDLFVQNDAGKADLEKLKRDDEWMRKFSPSGVFVRGEINPEHWLGFGLPAQMPLRFSGGNVLLSKAPVATPVRVGKQDGLRLSGLLWPEARERLADSAYVTVEKLGKGQVILFACDPTFRAWLPGHERLLLNAAILGPGLGATPPARW